MILFWHIDDTLGFHPDLEVVVAGEGNEKVEKETFAVFIHLWSVVVQTWTIKHTSSKTTTGL